MYKFLYIKPIQKLLSTELKIGQDNFSHIYDLNNQTILDNYDNTTPRQMNEGCKYFVGANSIDYIYSIDFFNRKIIKELGKKYQEYKEKIEIEKREFSNSIDELNDEDFDTELNKYNFFSINKEFEENIKRELLAFDRFISIPENILIEDLREAYFQELENSKEVFQLKDTIYEQIVQEVADANIELPFSIEERKELYNKILDKVKKQHEYFYSRPLRVENFKKYGLEVPVFIEKNYICK